MITKRARTSTAYRKPRCDFALVLVMVLSTLVFPRGAAAQEGSLSQQPGLQVEKPEGRSVKTAKGFMVHYREAIPGTNVTFDMVPIPAGKFVIGSPVTEQGRKPHEGPQIELRVEPFWMGRCEVTWSEYRVFMDCYEIFKERGRIDQEVPEKFDAVTAPTPLYDPATVYSLGEDPREPAVAMTQFAARQYTKWLSLLTGEFYRLPTEAEWEYAARAGSRTAYFFGKDSGDLDRYAWFADNSNQLYHTVGSKKANPWGLFDIYGNVAELTLDPFEEDTYSRWAEGSRSAAPRNWITEVHREVVRGGSWDSKPPALRSASRDRTKPNWQQGDPNNPQSPWWYTEEEALMVGFRIVRPLVTPAKLLRQRNWGETKVLRDDLDSRLSIGRGVRGVVDSQLSQEIQKRRGSQQEPKP
ncbi:MAG: formylglycine-generating enzyme family protein [Planctomycetaceae bacterium]